MPSLKTRSPLPHGVLYVKENEDRNQSWRNPGGYVFLCNSRTEYECLDRGLFGAPASYWNAMSQIKRGDVIFLFNFETTQLHGVFEAESDAAINVDPWAFGGHFPVQVRVSRKIECPPAGIGTLLPLIKRRWIKVSRKGILSFPTRLPPKFTEELYRILMQIPRLPVSYTRQSGFKARDGHITKSFSERYVDDWLHVHMPYEHHYFYSMKGVAGNMTCDWYIPALGLHIDYWETSGNEQTNSMYLQHRFYRTNCLKAIDICEDDVLHLDSIIPARVRAVGVSCNFRKERR